MRFRRILQRMGVVDRHMEGVNKSGAAFE